MDLEPSAAFLDRSTLIHLLAELGQEMVRRGLHADIFIVGGAAMALAYDTQRTTRDIDAVFAPKTAVYEAAARVAARHGLNKDWLNDSAQGFLLGEDPARQTVFEGPGINVMVASPEYLLAMKVYAARVDRDEADIRFLAGVCGLRTAEDVLRAAERRLQGRPVLPKVQFMVEEMFNAPE